MTSSRKLPFPEVGPQDAVAVAVMEESSAFVGFNRAAAESVFGQSFDAMAAVYQLALQQTLASLMPMRSVLELKPSAN